MIVIFTEEADKEHGIPTHNQSELMKRAAGFCLLAEGIVAEDGKDSGSDSLSVSVSFVDEDEIRNINSRYRDKDAVTDVLSFPMYESAEELVRELHSKDSDADEEPLQEELSLGDVVICNSRVVSQAAEYGHSEDRELVYLFVHSMLHLLGYDHMEDDDKKAMRAREEEIMAKLGIDRE